MGVLVAVLACLPGCADVLGLGEFVDAAAGGAGGVGGTGGQGGAGGDGGTQGGSGGGAVTYGCQLVGEAFDVLAPSDLAGVLAAGADQLSVVPSQAGVHIAALVPSAAAGGKRIVARTVRGPIDAGPVVASDLLTGSAVSLSDGFLLPGRVAFPVVSSGLVGHVEFGAQPNVSGAGSPYEYPYAPECGNSRPRQLRAHADAVEPSVVRYAGSCNSEFDPTWALFFGSVYPAGAGVDAIVTAPKGSDTMRLRSFAHFENRPLVLAGGEAPGAPLSLLAMNYALLAELGTVLESASPFSADPTLSTSLLGVSPRPPGEGGGWFVAASTYDGAAGNAVPATLRVANVGEPELPIATTNPAELFSSSLTWNSVADLGSMRLGRSFGTYYGAQLVGETSGGGSAVELYWWGADQVLRVGGFEVAKGSIGSATVVELEGLEVLVTWTELGPSSRVVAQRVLCASQGD